VDVDVAVGATRKRGRYGNIALGSSDQSEINSLSSSGVGISYNT
jgi:hypothetical protein